MLRAQVRAGYAGFIGLDASACLALLTAHGLPTDIAALFLPYWEAGVSAAYADKQDEKS